MLSRTSALKRLSSCAKRRSSPGSTTALATPTLAFRRAASDRCAWGAPTPRTIRPTQGQGRRPDSAGVPVPLCHIGSPSELPSFKPRTGLLNRLEAMTPQKSSVPWFLRSAAAAALLALAPQAHAGGTPENILLVINPANAESLYLGNYYKNARNIPDRNVLYIDPAPATYADFCAANGVLDATLGQLANVRISDHIDYIVVASPAAFYVNAPGYVIDGCSPVTRFSQTAVFTMAYIKSQVLAGGIGQGSQAGTNQYFSAGNPVAFNSR